LEFVGNLTIDLYEESEKLDIKNQQSNEVTYSIYCYARAFSIGRTLDAPNVTAWHDSGIRGRRSIAEATVVIENSYRGVRF